MIVKLKEKFKKEVIPMMMEKFGYKNKMTVPEIERVVVNTGFGRQISGKTTDEQKKLVKAAMERQHKAFREMFVAGKEKMEAAKDLLVQDMIC